MTGFFEQLRVDTLGIYVIDMLIKSRNITRGMFKKLDRLKVLFY